MTPHGDLVARLELALNETLLGRGIKTANVQRNYRLSFADADRLMKLREACFDALGALAAPPPPADPPALVALVRVAAPFLVKEFDKHHCASMKCPWCDLVWPLLAYPLPAAPPVTDTPQGCPTCGGPRPCDRCTTRNVVDVDALKARLESERLRAAAEIVKLIADDSWAIAFQSLGQYRSALLKAWRDSAPAAPPQEDQ